MCKCVVTTWSPRRYAHVTCHLGVSNCSDNQFLSFISTSIFPPNALPFEEMLSSHLCPFNWTARIGGCGQFAIVLVPLWFSHDSYWVRGSNFNISRTFCTDVRSRRGCLFNMSHQEGCRRLWGGSQWGFWGWRWWNGWSWTWAWCIGGAVSR